MSSSRKGTKCETWLCRRRQSLQANGQIPTSTSPPASRPELCRRDFRPVIPVLAFLAEESRQCRRSRRVRLLESSSPSCNPAHDDAASQETYEFACNGFRLLIKRNTVRRTANN